MKRERGLIELQEKGPEEADEVLWGRRANPVTRRGFLKRAGLGAMTLALGASIPYWRSMPTGLVPAALADVSVDEWIASKGELRVLSDRPFNAETPPYLLDDDVTPTARHFVRNNGIPPAVEATRSDEWTLTIDGEVERPLRLNLSDLKRYPQVDRALVLECAGNGRASFYPPALGNQWTIGAVGCSRYKGVRLRDVLADAGVKASAIYTAYYGADVHLSGDLNKRPISRGTPVAKALDEQSLLVFEMNGEPLPLLHGAPVRMICPGWPGSTGGKWLNRIALRDQVHDGAKMTGTSYRVPDRPVRPGEPVPEDRMRIIERMPVKSLISSPRSGLEIDEGTRLKVEGHAWSGERSIRAVDVSYDFGSTWIPARLRAPRNAGAWQRWRVDVSFPQVGYYELWARATDSALEMQPMVVPGWNPKGYLNNAMHRIAVVVG